MTLTIGSLFAGVGGLELGLEWAGLGPVLWQVEKEPFCRQVLAKHWPDVTRYEDVCDVGAVEPVDLICGGAPCQDLSPAGKRAGIDGPRSGLWREYARIVGELEPRWVVAENVQHTWRQWVPRVRSDLHRLGYASVPLQLSAAEVGAQHLRRRVFVVAHPDGKLLRELSRRWCGSGRQGAPEPRQPRWGPTREQLQGESDGVPHGLERSRALGNAVVPQCAGVIGNVIRELMEGE